MQIDRRITNGLAWAGAVLVVGIPLADFAMRQGAPLTSPQVAVVQEDPQAAAAVEVPAAKPATTLPTPVSERPEPQQPAPMPAPDADPVETASARPAQSAGAVDDYLQSGRDLPSYISGGTSETARPQPAQSTTTTTAAAAPATPSRPTSTATSTTTTPAVAAGGRPVTTTAPPRTTLVPATTTDAETVAARPERSTVTLPTPVSQRPAPVASSQIRPAPQTGALVVDEPAPLVVEQPAPFVVEEPSDGIITANDLNEWETGPLSEFLASRRGQPAPVSDYDGDGFFLDEGPQQGRRQAAPRAFGEGFYYPLND